MARFMRLLAFTMLCAIARGQSGDPASKFEVAQIQLSRPSARRFMTGPVRQGVRYELKNATMADLISTAYGVDSDKVAGGPSWIEFDRFDVVAKTPPSTPADALKGMLQALLADRFKLKVHSETKPYPAYSMTAGKNPKLKEAHGSEDHGCQFRIQGLPARGGPAEGPATPPNLVASCHNVTMASLADMIAEFAPPQMVNGTQSRSKVKDDTGLAGAYDAEFQFSLDDRGGDTAMMDNIEKQLGLKLEPVEVPMTVMVVDGVDRKPTENPADADASFPPLPAEFEVASLKPSAPLPPPGTRMARGPAYQNDRVNLVGSTLRQLINIAWNITGDDMVADVPKFAESDRYDVVAKVPSSVAVVTRGPVDVDLYRPMFQQLLIDRFQMKIHFEERPVNAYVLSAVKPKLQKADPANRTRWIEGPGSDGKDPRKANSALGRLVTCQNMTMPEFAALLPSIAPGYLRTLVQDETGLEGAWDFTLNFSGAGIINGQGRGSDVAATTGAPSAADPSGGLSLSDAISKQLGLKLEMQKRPMRVLVIDHMEQKPKEN